MGPIQTNTNHTNRTGKDGGGTSGGPPWGKSGRDGGASGKSERVVGEHLGDLRGEIGKGGGEQLKAQVR